MAEAVPHVVVRNTFLEFSDDTPPLEFEPRKVRSISDMTDLKLSTKTEVAGPNPTTPGLGMQTFAVSRHRLASTLEGGPVTQPAGSSSAAGIIGTVTTGLPTVVEEPYNADVGTRRRTSSMQQMVLERDGFGGLGGAHMPASGGAGASMPFMGGMGGQVPPYTAPPPSMFWGAYGGLGGPQMPPPPFPPGVLPFGGGYPNQIGQAPPGNFNPPAAQLQTTQPGMPGLASTTSYRVQAPDAGRNRLQLVEHLQPGATGSLVMQGATAVAPEMQKPGELTTVMLRNVPNGYTRNMLLELIDGLGFQGRYDFVYLPMDFRNGVNLGYAFVNTLNHDDANRLTEQLQGFSAWTSDSSKICEVSWAHPNQGLAEHVERYRNSPVMHPTMPDEYKPMVFSGGVRVPFPAPTKAIKAPKLRLTAAAKA